MSCFQRFFFGAFSVFNWYLMEVLYVTLLNCFRSNFIDEDEMNSFSAAGVYQNLLQLVYNNAMRKINPIGSLRSKDLIAKYFKEDTGIKREH